MINILPEEGKRTARAEYRLRLVSMGACMGMVVVLSAGAFLFPSYVTSSAAAEEARVEAQRLADAKQKRGETTDAPLALAEAELRVIAPSLGGRLPSTALAELLAQRLPGISLTQVRFEAGTRTATLSGQAVSREKLLSFVQALRKVEGVEKADVPVSDLAKSENAPFSITVVFSEIKS